MFGVRPSVNWTCDVWCQAECQLDMRCWCKTSWTMYWSISVWDVRRNFEKHRHRGTERRGSERGGKVGVGGTGRVGGRSVRGRVNHIDRVGKT